VHFLRHFNGETRGYKEPEFYIQQLTTLEALFKYEEKMGDKFSVSQDDNLRGAWGVIGRISVFGL
jgi:hypothetical protein